MPIPALAPRPARPGSRRGIAGLAALALFAAAACDQPEVPELQVEGLPRASAPDASELFEVPPPPFKDEGIFPCSDCHDPELPVNTKRRELKMAHQDIVLHHDEENRWCLDCHDAADRDMLHLASGKLVAFEESYKLCGQCHGDKYRDWRAGVHGRRTGHWDGQKSYLLCVHCHDSHSPRFKPLKPLPPPPKPKRTP